ncbi:unnamed protein product [Owenia fusiformis]|uniref:Uncharacterized protein n=1 Tax=Owenia fusiformis TaxID=6347 RepID=A0A8J1XK58_OWEFU|nr:unnamed protein product [Owenia fusiformis]
MNTTTNTIPSYTNGTETLTTNLSNDNETIYVPQQAKFSTEVTVILIIMTSLMALLTIFGNILVLTAFTLYKNLRTFNNYLVLNLAVADLILGVLCIPLYIPYLVTGTWPMGRIACKIWLVFDYLVGCVSSVNIMLICMDRYYSIAYPLKHRLAQDSHKVKLIYIITPWLAGFITYMPAIAFWDMWVGNSVVPDDQCFVEFYNNLGYLLFSQVIEFFIPFTTVCILYTLMFISIRRTTNGNMSVRRHRTVNNPNSENSYNSESPYKRNNANNKYNKDTRHNTDGHITHGHSTEVRHATRLNNVAGVNESKESLNSYTSVLTRSTLVGEGNDIRNSPIIGKTHNDRTHNDKTHNDKTHHDKTHHDSNNQNNLFPSATIVKTPKIDKIRAKFLDDKKAVISLSILVGVFGICWMPYEIAALMISLCPTCVHPTVFEVAFWLLWINSTINPLLYPFFNARFKLAFKRMLCPKLIKQKGVNKRSDVSNMFNGTHREIPHFEDHGAVLENVVIFHTETPIY